MIQNETPMHKYSNNGTRNNTCNTQKTHAMTHTQGHINTMTNTQRMTHTNNETHINIQNDTYKTLTCVHVL